MEDNKEEGVQEITAQEVERLSAIVENLQFFSDPVRFNSVMYQGLKKILQKLESLEAKITLLEEKPKPKNEML